MSDHKAKKEVVLEGIAASPGVAHGKAFLFLQKQVDVPCYDIKADAVDAELERLDQGIVQTHKEITAVRNKVAKSLGEGEALIFDAHLMVLEDNALIDEVVSDVRKQKKNVEFCFNKVVNRYIQFFSTVEDEYLRERVSDIRDVSRRLLHNLTGSKKASLSNLAGDSIVVSEDISPSDTADLDRHNLLSFVTDAGGKTSHSVIMARSIGIPAVVGLHNATDQIKTGDDILVDGYDGLVIINPTEERLFQYGKLATERRKLEAIYTTVLDEPSETRDGVPIAIMANIEGAQEMKQVASMRADGVGLFRTEGIFLRSHGYPSEEEQYEEYAAAAKAADGKPVIIRTLDIGGDKTIGGESEEDNSFLGFRAIRFCLENVDIFKTQLRAILRASAVGNVKLMYPMISGLRELMRANDVLKAVKAELRQEGLAFDDAMEIGAMIEVPSAVTVIDLLSREVDFFSVGTNDLIQYLMAVDRLNDRVAHLYEPTHPAVIRTLKQIIDGAKLEGKPVSVCGEIAGDPIFASILLGLGAQSLSLTSSLLPEVKYFIRKMDSAKAKELVQEVLGMDDAHSILLRLERFQSETIGDLI
ncbi:phosphoenolpyruvate--protein phosphotransferase [Coraliomargarita parva]|uniref:phosphoenolpyruvate--protein phosphotransferase n=1 Tax=Coraliomargarita parva TaxID=3014050 RepID=UPI0022B49687|nr:phosphoenolpyruvate--protein phosphotransferase [Coraliomargarita parva]